MSPTARQLEALRFIHGYMIAHRGVAPTLNEIAAGIGGSKTPVKRIVDGLCERGLVRRLSNRPRALEVLAPPAIPTIGGAPLYAVPLRQGS